MCREVLSVEHYNTKAMLLLGVIEAKAGDPLEGIRLLDEVQGMEPNSFHAPFWQSHAYKKLGRSIEALEAALRANEANPQDAQGITQVGICYQDVRLLNEAEAYLRKAAETAPSIIQIRFNLSQCLLMQGKREEARETVRTTLAASRPPLEALLSITQFFLTQNAPLLAAECARRAIELNPTSGPAKMLLGRSLLEDGQPELAIVEMEAAAKESPLDSEAQSMLGTAYQGVGRLDDAIKAFEQSIFLRPKFGYPYFGIVNSKRVTPADQPMIDKMRHLLEDKAMPTKQQSYLQYGVGKAMEDLGQFQASMEAFDAANLIEFELKFKGKNLDRDLYTSQLDQILRLYSSNFVSKNKDAGLPSEVPIFIVGMIRSGTTLVEHILSCHPEVGVAGEQSFWNDNWRGCIVESRGDLNRKGLTDAANRYLALLDEIAPGKPRVADKMPGNFAMLGIIRTAYPNAKIIHVRRNPIDTCLSMYVTPNRAANDTAHNKSNIAFGYSQYLRVMDHWRKVLPAEGFLEIDYEALVADSEAITRQIVEFCGLEWNELCLKPQDSRRTVITPSVWQVRQPLYQSSVERWRHFEPWIEEFISLSAK